MYQRGKEKTLRKNDEKEHHTMEEGQSLSDPFDIVKTMEYPGRLIIVGKSPGGVKMALYAITGRSPSSRARILSIDEERNRISITPTDREVLNVGQPDLLIYSAIIGIGGSTVVVGNGRQTEDIVAAFEQGANPVEILMRGQRHWQYEPDAPHYTPRISGCVASTAALSIIKHARDGSVVRHYIDAPLVAGVGYLIATYAGANVSPLPSFKGEPIEVSIPSDEPQACIDALYNALGPSREKNTDLRVSVACAAVGNDGRLVLKVKNRFASVTAAT